MLPKCLILLLFFSFIEADHPYHSPFQQPCSYPKLDHGRVRVRMRSGLVKFTCALRYELVGNRYAICRNGHWDVPLPVCVRSGCEELPASPNAIQVKEHHGAWVVTFCLPGHKLIGSPTVYCDGRNWNGTAPICSDINTINNLSCDFEDPAICGWTQDELHDFDWKRWNKKTPSSFLFTGPSYDHTYGENQMGFYMYIESTSRQENHTARLLSPIYDSSLAVNGCFSFYYHMYGRDIGGLRVYQKPDQVQLITMLTEEAEREKYLLFERWGDRGDVWYNAVPQLRSVGDDFQIVIEGIRGASFTSDIAIDDVAILQGDNCTKMRQTTASPEPSPNPISCANRCNVFNTVDVSHCSCVLGCLINMDCCPDFIDVCWSPGTTTDDDDDSSVSGLPQTQKLVGETTTTKPYSVSTTAVITSTSRSTPKPTIKTVVTTTTKLTTTHIPTATQKESITTQVPTTTEKTTTKTIATTTPNIPTTSTTNIRTSTKHIPTTTQKVATTTQKARITTKKPSTTTQKLPTTTKKAPITTQKIFITTRAVTSTAKTPTDYIEMEKKKMETESNLQKITDVKAKKPTNKSSTWTTALITVVVLAMCACAVYLVVYARSARGRHAISRLRGRTVQDSEVRYLNSNSDDDL